ncbi:MAG: DUF5810 domain-containing protein [Halobacteriaceae archaeon]
MGYACPVCGAPQRDGEHLANHLAFTAVLRGGDHESWLDERIADWADRDPASLADDVTDYADEEEFPQIFEDTTDDHDHGHPFEDAVAEQSGYGRDGGADLDPETEAVLEEARDLTAEMLDEDDNGKE